MISPRDQVVTILRQAIAARETSSRLGALSCFPLISLLDMLHIMSESFRSYVVILTPFGKSCCSLLWLMLVHLHFGVLSLGRTLVLSHFVPPLSLWVG